MNRKTVSGTMVTLLLIGMLAFSFNIQPVIASGTIYIRADGSVDPDTAPILTTDNVTYTFTGNITDSIFVERDNIVVDGAGYTVQGESAFPSWSMYGIQLRGRSNVTIRNVQIKAWANGIVFDLESSDINISENKITNNFDGIRFGGSSNNSISGNNITSNEWGIYISYSSNNNTISGNNIINNREGIWLGFCSNNIIYHNNFVNNTYQAYTNQMNFWDDGYPSGGNYWSDYEETYPDAEELDDSGIWDTPYVIDGNNQDNYPLMEPWTPTPPIPTTISQLKTEIEELGSEGEIDNKGIVKSLIAKLNVAQKLIDDGKIDQAENILNAFINEVQAQSGKHITPDAADILIESAEYILSHL